MCHSIVVILLISFKSNGDWLLSRNYHKSKKPQIIFSGNSIYQGIILNVLLNRFSQIFLHFCYVAEMTLKNEITCSISLSYSTHKGATRFYYYRLFFQTYQLRKVAKIFINGSSLMLIGIKFKKGQREKPLTMSLLNSY